MPNIINEAIANEYTELFSEDLDGLLVQPVGLSVADVNDFRSKLAEANLRMQVVKGTLARRALESHGMQVQDQLFIGPSALIVADGETDGAAIAAARVLEDWAKGGHELPAVKGGVLEGEVLGPDQAKSLAKLPTRAEMQSIISGQIIAPAAKLSGQLVAGGGKIAGAIKSHIEKLEG